MQKNETIPPPPGVINSLRVGFDVVSSRVILIVLPVIMDVFLWLGPRMSVGTLYTSLLSDWAKLGKEFGFPLPDMEVMAERVDLIGRVNFLSGIRTLPIGIPSMLSGIVPASLPQSTPFGEQTVIQVPSAMAMLGWLLLLTAVGWVLGGLYFRWVSGATLGENEAAITPWRAILQTVILSLIWLAGAVILLMPIGLILGLLLAASPALANGVTLVLTVFAFWFIVPLFFTPHGIFIHGQNGLHSAINSMKMARYTLPSSSIFVFAVFVLSTGLNFLWSVPKSDSWMLLVGIAGHAFITTALLSASFVYYRDLNIWLKAVLEKIQKAKGLPAQQV